MFWQEFVNSMLDGIPPPEDIKRPDETGSGDTSADVELRAIDSENAVECSAERRLAYVVQLVLWSYHEHLLDRRSFMDWLFNKLQVR